MPEKREKECNIVEKREICYTKLSAEGSGEGHMMDLYLREIRLESTKTPKKYPFCLPAVKSLGTLRLEKPVTFFVGENGTGKSTLLEAVAINYGFNAEGGSKNFRFTTVESHSELHEHIRLVKGIRRPQDGYFLRAESFYNVISEIDDKDLAGYYGGNSLHSCSHGEGFWALVTERFFGQGLYFLDEPEAALSPTRQMALLSRMHQLVKEKSQFIIATHAPILLAYPDADIYELTQEGIHRVAYRDTETYQVTKRFLQNPEGMLDILLR